MKVVSVDLDDTLIATQVEYERAKEWFGEYMRRNFDVSYEDALSEYDKCDSRAIDEFGLSRYRFPNSAVRALGNLVGESTHEIGDHKNKVYDIGRSAFKNREQYKQKGLIEPGVGSFLDTVKNLSDKSILLTAGDSEIQYRKIKALSLTQYFDVIEVVDMNGKQEVLQEFGDTEKLIHIGNSMKSDVQPAANVNADCIYIPRGEWIETDNEYDGNGSIYTVSNTSEAEEILKQILGR